MNLIFCKMAGHSHSSNVKHKKDRNDKKKCKDFLKLREKIKSIIKNGNEFNKKKAFTLARENNFPKEKVELMIDKYSSQKYYQENSKLEVFKCKFDIKFVLYNFESFFIEEETRRNFLELFSVSTLNKEKISSIFNQKEVLLIKSNWKFEDLIFDVFKENDFFENINILKIKEKDFNFQVFFNEKKQAEKIINMKEVEKYELKKVFLPFNNINLFSEDSLEYFRNIKKFIYNYIPKEKVFFNVFDSNN